MKKRTLKPDTVLKDYWRNNERFADLFNQVLFHGTDRIIPEKLSDKDTEESAVIMEKDQTITSISRARDTIKQYADGINLALIGIENQMNVHYAMPARSMTYEALEYSKQCKELVQKHRENKDLVGANEFLSGLTLGDRLKPTITLVIYYGEKPWDGPLKLSDMMDIPEYFLPYFNDYQVHLLSVHTAHDFHFLNQDNRDFFMMIEEFYGNKGKVDIESFRRKYPDLDIYWETLAAIGAATGSTELLEYALSNEGREIHMCTALENLKKEGVREGRREGIQEGRAEGIIKTMKKYHASDSDIVEELMSSLEITKREAEEFLTKYDQGVSGTE